MSYAKVGTDGLSVPAKIQYLRRLATAITGNPNFPTPNPTAAALTAAADALEAAYNEAQAARLVSKTKTANQDDQSAIVDLLVAQLASYVDNASGGSAEKIESAGFAVRATPSPVGELPAPTDVQVLPSEHAGSADVSWSPLRGAKAYIIERAPEAPSLNWGVIGTSTRAKASLNSMASGSKYWFRVAAVGAAGQSAWSDPVPLFAP
ncbi:MAG: hypothetical protein RLY20_1962 [Verrucomicrobiota bacterium]|jgi:hypothetical protein